MRRLATQADLDQVYDIYMHEAVVPYLGFDPMPKEDFRAVYRELLASNCFFVYEHAGRVAGFYKAMRHAGRIRHVGFISNLAIDPALSGTGVANHMLEELLGELREAGVRRVEVAVESDNPKAIRFYQRHGFAIEGTLKEYYKRADQDHYIDEHIMAVLLR